SWNLWGYIDHRDAAQAVRLAVEADRQGAEVFIVAADDTVMRRPSVELLTGALAELERRAPIEGRATLLSNAKARRELGFRPRYSWVNRVDG
ncbi:NAD(P)-dependent oxidoreductase, partial [Burkholderia cenocepacia]